MNADDAGSLARRTLRRGYFRPDNAAPFVRCPECRVSVSRSMPAHFRAAEIARGLCEALAAHLRDGCAPTPASTS